MNKKRIGIITIHRIFNYGSVFQSYALQEVCTSLGFDVEIIDYAYPNDFHHRNVTNEQLNTYVETKKEKLFRWFFKLVYLLSLLKQHKCIVKFRNKYLNLSDSTYYSPQEVEQKISHYDVYLTGSDQIWNPRYTGGDGTFFFNFLKDVKKIAYSSSFGISSIPKEYHHKYADYLKDFSSLSVREKSGIPIIKQLVGKEAQLVLDPTLLLTKTSWNKIAVMPKYKFKYILCYFLNYTFNAFPYIDDLAEYIAEQTGLTLVHVARPPQKLRNKNSIFNVSASPEEFLGLMANAELIITTSFHGTAFAVNYNKPVYSVVQSRESNDSRLIDLLNSLDLGSRLLYLNDTFPDRKDFFNVPHYVESKLDELRRDSTNYLTKALYD